MQRQDEILAKKAKLAELRRQRELRQKEFSASRQSLGGGIGGGASPGLQETAAARSPGRADRAEIEKLVSSVLGEDGVKSPRQAPSTPPAKEKAADSQTSADKPVRPATVQALSFAPLQTVYEIRSAPPRREVQTYSKGVQTEAAERSPSPSEAGERPPRRRLSRRELDREREEELRQNLRREIEEELQAVRDPSAAALDKANFPARALTDEEREAVTSSSAFSEFVERSSRVIERALDEEYDVLADYRAGNLSGADDDAEDISGPQSKRIKQVLQFYDERWSKRRMISDIGFSPKFPELVLSAHTKDPSLPYEPPGVIQIWNAHLHSRPEYIFHANSDILTAKFSPYHPNLVLGGTYSGQVLLWDTRSKTSQPVQKTPLTGTGFGHTHPIYSISVVGTQNAHNIVSASTDGVVCSWSIDMLSQPQEYLELSAPLPSTTNNVPGTVVPYTLPTTISPLSTAFPLTDPSYFLAGTEAGPIHLVHRYDRAGSKAGVDASTTLTGHAAPVMSLDFHRATGPLDLSDLLLSTGLDWTVRLWRVKTPASVGAAALQGAEKERRQRDVKPLLSMQRDEPVYDARWSPARPSVFASVDGAGMLEVWDLNVELETPVAKATPTARPEHRGPPRSLNKVAWESGRGARCAVGGLDGQLTIYQVGGGLCGPGAGEAAVKQDEWAQMKRLVTRLEGI